MATSKSIANLHATLTANVRQYDAEMQKAAARTKATESSVTGSFAAMSNGSFGSMSRMEARTRAAFDRMDRDMRRGSRGAASAVASEFDQMMKAVSAGFAPAKWGGALLSGAGVGSAVAVVNLAMDQFIEKWRESEFQAAKVEARAKSIAEAMARMRSAQFAEADALRSPSEKLAVRSDTIEGLMAQVEQQKAALAKARRGVALADRFPYASDRIRKFEGESVGGMLRDDFRASMSEQVDQATLKLAELRTRISEVKQESNELGNSLVESQLAEFFGPLDEQAKQLQELAGAMIGFGDAEDYTSRQSAAIADAHAAGSERLAEFAALLDQSRTPLDAYNAELDRLRNLELWLIANGQDMAAVQNSIAEAMGRAGAKYVEASGDVEDYASRQSKALESYQSNFKIIEGSGLQFQQSMALMWSNVSNSAGESFADMVIEGEASFSQLADIVARSVIQITAQMALINPLMNSIFNLSGANALPAFFSLGGHADGGNYQASRPFLAGERGPELIFPGATAGAVATAGQTSRMLSGQSGTAAAPINFTYNIAGGVTASELMPILKAQEKRTIAAMQSAQMRRQIAA